MNSLGTSSDAVADSRRALVESTHAIAPALRREADAAERDSRLTEAATRALRKAGMFRLGVPGRFGGYQASPATCLDVTAEIGLACPSSAWIVAVTYAAQLLAASFGEQARRDMWAEDADTPMCGVFGGTGVVTERIQGGLLISGAWSWASGCYQAKWALLTAPLPGPDPAQAEQGLALVPVADLTIKDTWDMAGMRGTGSHTLLGDRVFVPEYRLRSFARILEGHQGSALGPLYTIPAGSLIVTLMGPLLGIGREVFRRTLETVGSGKPLTGSVYRSLADSPSVQAAVANAATLIDSASLHLARSAEFVDAAAEAGNAPALVDRARVRMDIGHASRCLREAVQLLLTVNGAGSFARANVMQRYWRDLETAARHPSLNPELAREMYGRALVGNRQPVSHMV